MTSITTWLRLEPRCRRADIDAGLQARVHDPLWLLGRQWQVGEFQGSDAGSPAMAEWRGEATRLSHHAPGVVGPGGVAVGRALQQGAPLEAIVEGEPVALAGRLRLAADAGRQFLRLLGQQALSRRYDAEVVAAFGFLAPTEADRRGLDGESLAFLEVMAERVPDGRRLLAALAPALRPVPPGRPALPAALGVARADAAEVTAAALAWLDWVGSVFSASHATGWNAERLEYGLAVAARDGGGEVVLTADEYAGGRLDWAAFDIAPGASLGTPAAEAEALVQTTVPAPVTYRGMPAARFWEFEDRRVDFGAVDAGPEDLARMLLVEFALTYGNDWFVLPIELATGTLVRTRALIVTDTFGERYLVPAAHEAGSPAAAWRMFVLSERTGSGAVPRDGLFLLPQSVVAPLEGRAVEEVAFLRDEMANMAWAIERTVESAAERPRDRAAKAMAEAPAPAPAAGAAAYRLASVPPGHWVPLVPVQGPDGRRLRRARVLAADGTAAAVAAEGRLLEAPGLALHEAEVPREGVRVTRTCRLARGEDGSTHLWIGRRKRVGRGEGSSGMAFDRLEE